MGNTRHFAALRATALLAVSALVFLPLGGMSATASGGRGAEPVDAPILAGDGGQSPPTLDRWSDDKWGLSITLPVGWQRSPAESLKPVMQPADPVFEVARYQLRLGDPSLYAQPIALTSALLNDAGAVISIGVARIGSGLVGASPGRWEETTRVLKGFVAIDEDSSYEGLRSFARYYFAKATDRVVVVRLFADEDEWSYVRALLFSSLATLAADATKGNGPMAVAPAPSAPAPTPGPAGDGGRAPRRSIHPSRYVARSSRAPPRC